MALIRLNALSISFGDKPVLDKIDLAISADERIALVGRNGMGKSTLLKILAGEIHADSGEIVRTQGLTIARLEQEVPDSLQGDIYSVVASGLGDPGIGWLIIKDFRNPIRQQTILQISNCYNPRLTLSMPGRWHNESQRHSRECSLMLQRLFLPCQVV